MSFQEVFWLKRSNLNSNPLGAKARNIIERTSNPFLVSIEYRIIMCMCVCVRFRFHTDCNLIDKVTNHAID